MIVIVSMIMTSLIGTERAKRHTSFNLSEYGTQLATAMQVSTELHDPLALAATQVRSYFFS